VNHITVRILFVSLMGGIIGLDRVFMQVMISRPIVSAPLIGLMLGDAYTGLIAGALLELFWINRLPIGTIVPPNDFLAAVLVASSAIIAGQEIGRTTRELVAFSVLFFVPFAHLGQKVDSFIVSSNDKLAGDALNAAMEADTGRIFRKHMEGLGKTFLCYSIFIFFSLLIGTTFLIHVFPLLPAACLTALTLTYFSLPLLGVAAGLNTINMKGAVPIFCAAFFAVSLLLELIRMF
jgi:mannose PTS system EIIC component